MITLITFLAAILNVPFAIACLMGLKLDTSGLKCPDDIKDVEINKKWVKGIQLTNAILFVLLTILTSI